MYVRGSVFLLWRDQSLWRLVHRQIMVMKMRMKLIMTMIMVMIMMIILLILQQVEAAWSYAGHKREREREREESNERADESPLNGSFLSKGRESGWKVLTKWWGIGWNALTKPYSFRAPESPPLSEKPFKRPPSSKRREHMMSRTYGITNETMCKIYVHKYICIYTYIYICVHIIYMTSRRRQNVCVCSTYVHTYISTCVLMYRGHNVTKAIQRARTRFAAARQVRNAHERDLVTNKNARRHFSLDARQQILFLGAVSLRTGPGREGCTRGGSAYFVSIWNIYVYIHCLVYFCIIIFPYRLYMKMYV